MNNENSSSATAEDNLKNSEMYVGMIDGARSMMQKFSQKNFENPDAWVNLNKDVKDKAFSLIKKSFQKMMKEKKLYQASDAHAFATVWKMIRQDLIAEASVNLFTKDKTNNV